MEKPIDVEYFCQSKLQISGKRVRCLTKDTGNCLPQTCNSLVKLPISILSQIHEYVKLWDFTSDPYENQFGKLKWGPDGVKFVTVWKFLKKGFNI